MSEWLQNRFRWYRWLRRHVTARRLFVVWIVVFSLAVGYAIRENRNRVDDIQKARVTSCQRTYEGIREVFMPFFPPKKHRTAEQRHDFELFNKTINNLKAKCSAQTQATK